MKDIMQRFIFLLPSKVCFNVREQRYGVIKITNE